MIDPLKISLPSELEQKYQHALGDWTTNGKVQRLWKRDASLWTNADESKWMGWLDAISEQQRDIEKLQSLQAEIREHGYKHALLLGMGGSSLCPEVTAFTFGKQQGYPELLILDSTDPAQVAAVEKKIDYKSTVFIVASKSGSTLEPNVFKQYFFTRARKQLGEKAGTHFIAITDPGSKMEQIAKQDGFAHIYAGVPSIGGRYSALSNFGMVPAAIAGIDVRKLIDRASAMAKACGADVPADRNPGVMLGVALGVCGVNKRDKITVIASNAIFDLGAWLEQLIAESTGKIGKGLVPVDREPLGSPDVYGNDRVFVHLRLTSAADQKQDAAVEKLRAAGHPVLRIELQDAYDIGGEYFRWEIATAVAGSILAINPFDQPDVEASKVATRALTNEFEKTGALPLEAPFFAASSGGIELFADTANSDAIRSGTVKETLAGHLRAHLARAREGDYVALLGYIPMDADTEAQLQRARTAIRDRKRTATCVGFGPRFLHSTGQAYKGGPNSGVFLQITCNHKDDVSIPDAKYTFGVVEAAQARGDLAVLNERKRRTLRIHLPSADVKHLEDLSSAIEEALS